MENDMANPPTLNKKQPDKLLYLLILVASVQLIYPITRGWNQSEDIPIMLILYQLFYSSLIVAGILVAREKPRIMRLLIGLGAAWFVTGTIYALNQTAVWANISGYAVITIFQISVIYVLLLFIFNTQTVNRNVIYAACAVYFLLGGLFTPIYGMIESLTFFGTGGLNGGVHAFSDGVVGVGELFPWQTLTYYSYATLTTLGYGDVLPITMWARSAASLEAIIGVLYITVIMARLVGLYASTEIESELEQKSR